MHISCRHLSYSYPGTGPPVFNSLDWSLEGPGFFGLFGLSGTGKTTLARLISGELSPNQGSIDKSRDIAILYTHSAERLPGWETVGTHLRSVTKASRASLLEALLRDYEMEDYLECRFSGLSMGQKNRINLARYLVQDFDLLIADEVLANVDEPTRNQILERTKLLFPQKTFLYISHNVLEVARFSQAVYVLPHGHSTGIENICKISCLDQQAGSEAHEELIRERVYTILKAASGSSGP